MKTLTEIRSCRAMLADMRMSDNVLSTEIPQIDQAAAQHGAGAAVDRDRTALQGVEGEQRRVELIPDLMRELPGALDFAGRCVAPR